ncbi:MAG: hypothetical protein DRP65_01940 [Planctomycetota bacterium]|nr:MAG: hypothetical protein DRP65_01940 [Planctomycetota bacterium]
MNERNEITSAQYEQSPTRRTFIKDASAAVVGLSAASQIALAASSAKTTAKRNRRPNFIFVEPDSWNGRCLSMLQEPGIKRVTHNIERIADDRTTV